LLNETISTNSFYWCKCHFQQSFVYAILCTIIAECVAGPQKGEKWCSILCHQQVRQTIRTFMFCQISGKILGSALILVVVFKRLSDQNMQQRCKSPGQSPLWLYGITDPPSQQSVYHWLFVLFLLKFWNTTLDMWRYMYGVDSFNFLL